jgi:hypothetical protein
MRKALVEAAGVQFWKVLIQGIIFHDLIKLIVWGKQRELPELCLEPIVGY